MEAALRIDIRPEESSLRQTEETNLILQEKELCTKDGFNKTHVRKSSKELKIAKQRSCSLLPLRYNAVKLANVTNIFLLSGCFSCVIYVMTYYKLTKQHQGLVGQYYFDQNTCDNNNQTCHTLPWNVHYEDTSCVSYSTSTRKINLLKPGSYVLSLHLSIQSNIADSEKKTGSQIRLACIKSSSQEKCGRFDVESRQNDVFHVMKVHNKTQNFWVNFDSWRYIYSVQKLNTLTIVKI